MTRAFRAILVLLASLSLVTVGTAAAFASSSSWSVQLAPTGSLTRATSGSAVACPDADFCLQLGYGDTSTDLFAVVHADGTATTQTLPVPADADPSGGRWLFDLTCRSRTWCVAVGQYTVESGDYRPMIDTYAHGSWQAITGPGDATGLSRVACNATQCLATGTHFAADFDHPYLALLDGSAPWTAPVVHSSPAGALTNDPTCPKDGACFAQLTVESGPAADELVVQGADGAWTTKAFASPAQSQPYPFTVGQLACVGPRCYGLGTYRGLDSDNRLTVETLSISASGGAGAVHASPVGIPGPLAGASLDLEPTGMSCTRTRVGPLCAAAVDVTYGGRPSAGLVRYWGGSWHARIAPTPTGGTPHTVKLDSVSCAGYHCAAVGTYDVSGVGRAVVQDWTPGAWRATGLGVPAGLSAKDSLALDDVSCADDGHCLADGAVGYRAHGLEPLRLWTATYG